MIDILLSIEKLGLFSHLMISGALILSSVVFNRLVSSKVLSSNINMDAARTTVIRIRTISSIIVGLALFLLWATELRHTLISLAALGAATILATKELIACWTGSIFRAFVKPFEIGDTIEINSARGIVVDVGALNFKIAELGAGHQATGRILSIPSSLLFQFPARNLSSCGDYVIQFTRVPVDNTKDIMMLMDALLLAGVETCSEHEQAAKVSLDMAGKAIMANAPSPVTRVAIEPKDYLQTDLVLRYPCPKHSRAKFEQDILILFYSRTLVLRSSK